MPSFVSTLRLCAPALALGLTFGTATPPAAAAPEAPGLSGTWVHRKDPEEAKARKAAIESVVSDLSSFIRGRARDKLEERTAPAPAFNLKLTEDHVSITRGDETLRLELDAAPVTKKRGGQTAKVSAQRQADGGVTIVSAGEKGRIVRTYVRGAQADRLRVETRMTGERLGKPLAFTTSYRRR